MVSYVFALLAIASLVSARTPAGFQPSVGTDLVVDFGNTLINGQRVQRNRVQSQPRIGVSQRLSGSSYAVIMVDLDVPTNNARQTTTLLHWLQTGLTPTMQSTTLRGSFGNGNNNNNQQSVQAFLLMNTSNASPLATYIGPNPPARRPLSHRYTQLLVDTTGLTQQSAGFVALRNAAGTRQGFNVQQVLQRAGLQNKVVAANFFNVTNTGNRINAENSTEEEEEDSIAGAAATGTGLRTTGGAAAPTGRPVTAGAALTTMSGLAALVGLVMAL